jgi:hypothetical protein
METDKEAYLIPSNKPTPRGPCDLVSTKQPDGTVAIFAGSNEFWSDVSGQIDILTLDGTPVVTTRKSERGLLFSIEMFNLEKKLVAKISDNKSILIPKNYAYNKRSKDRSTITLFDDFDKEVLYVEYLNNRTVLIRGVFTGPNGTTVAINDNEILLGFNHGGAGASPAGRIFQVVLNLTVGRSECDLFDARAIANGLSYAPAVAGSPECHVETTRELGKQTDI